MTDQTQTTRTPLILTVIRELMEKAGLTEVFNDPNVPMVHLRMTNDPYTPLVVEKIKHLDDTGRLCISLAHYSEQEGDLMADPEMLFDWETGEPLYYKNSYLGVERWVYKPGSKRTLVNLRERADERSFAATWARNLRAQGWTKPGRGTCQSSSHPDLCPEPAPATN